MLIKLKEKVYLPRFNLKRGEIWRINPLLTKHKNNNSLDLLIGGGVVKQTQYEIIKTV